MSWFGGEMNGEESALCVQARVDISDYSGPGTIVMRQLLRPVYIDWGDGSVEYWSNFSTNAVNHNYSDSSRRYLIKYYDATGDGLRLVIGVLADDAKFMDIISFGSQKWYTADGSGTYGVFESVDNIGPCPFLKTSSPDFRTMNVYSTRFMFGNAAYFNGDISKWDVSKITNMLSMFNCSFAANLGQFSEFNVNIGGWDVSSVTNMQAMFLSALVFNQDIGSWDVSNVTNMSQMFRNASSFNQDIGSWDVSSLTNMSLMFSGTSSFNQDISGWSPATSAANFSNMLDNSAMSGANYSKWLIALANWSYDNDYTIAETLGASNVTYNSTTYTGIGSGQYTDAPSARAYLTGTRGWTIFDGGLA